MGGNSRLGSIACVLFLGAALPAAAEVSDRSTPPVEPAMLLQLSQSGATADVAVLQQAQVLLGSGQAAQAYELLSAHEADWAGIPLYDYLLGIAALDTGRPGEAIFALQRVVANEPGFAGARMELARAHFEAGELKASRSQFEYLLSQSPPDSTRSIIERYIEVIDGRGAGGGGLRPFVEFGAGYDSNANGSTAEQSFLGFTLDPRNIETSSSFMEAAVGVNHVLPVGESSSWINGVRVSHRHNPDADFIDQSIASAGTLLSWARERTRASAGINGYYSLLDGEEHEWGVALDLATGRRIGDNWDLGLTLRGGPVRYQDPLLEILDTDRYLGALTLSRLNVGGRAARIGLTLIGGVDDASEENSAYSNERFGGRANLGFETDYDDEPGFFGTDRQDEEMTGLLALEFAGWPGEGWSISPRVRYAQHDSNVALYEFDRWEASVYLRRSFR
jgi:outer membrane protein